VIASWKTQDAMGAFTLLLSTGSDLVGE